MTTTASSTDEDRALKERHRAMWALGDYPTLANDVIAGLGPVLVAACEVYNRLVVEARAARRQVQWQAALGHDRNRHADALRKAADLGRISRADADAAAALPAPRAPVLLLAGGTSAAGSEPSAAHRLALQALRAAVEARAAMPSADVLDRQRTAELRAAAAAQVDAYVTQQGGSA